MTAVHRREPACWDGIRCRAAFLRPHVFRAGMAGTALAFRGEKLLNANGLSPSERRSLVVVVDVVFLDKSEALDSPQVAGERLACSPVVKGRENSNRRSRSPVWGRRRRGTGPNRRRRSATDASAFRCGSCTSRRCLGAGHRDAAVFGLNTASVLQVCAHLCAGQCNTAVLGLFSRRWQRIAKG